MDIPLAARGWELIAYPIPENRPVKDALQSIQGAYTTVYAYRGSDVANPWRVYDTSAPDWANDLQALEFGEGYWIGVTQPITLQLALPSAPIRPAPAPNALGELTQLTPPTTFYGTIAAGASVAPPANAEVVATIGTAVCGKGPITRTADGQVRYVVKVAAASAAARDCGVLGRTVTFTSSTGLALGSETWDNSRPKQVQLQWP